jgi:hypothetical protein
MVGFGTTKFTRALWEPALLWNQLRSPRTAPTFAQRSITLTENRPDFRPKVISYNAGAVKYFLSFFFAFFPHCSIHSEMSAISLS